MSKSQLPTVPGANNMIKDEDPPLIPYEVLNGPTQRLYIVSIYVALNAWRLYNWFALVQSNTESLWLFLKWTAIDGIFLYNVPSLRIPYLRWPFSITTTIFLVHTLLTGMLMFRAYVGSMQAPNARLDKLMECEASFRIGAGDRNEGTFWLRHVRPRAEG